MLRITNIIITDRSFGRHELARSLARSLLIHYIVTCATRCGKEYARPSGVRQLARYAPSALDDVIVSTLSASSMATPWRYASNPSSEPSETSTTVACDFTSTLYETP